MGELTDLRSKRGRHRRDRSRGGSRRLTDEVFIMLVALFRQCTTYSTHARLALSAGVQAMRARICSTSSCDMFARVVWLKSRRVQNRRFLLCPLPHALATHYFMRLTRARGRRYIRGRNALLYDFWYFWSCKSTREEKLLYDYFGSSQKLGNAPLCILLSSRKSARNTNFLLPFPLPKNNIKSLFSHFGISYIDICNTDM